MKKILSALISITIIALTFACAVPCAANDITVELDGRTIDFDVAPQIIAGRTMVPLRKIFEEIGALVKWDNDTKTVSARKNSKTITLAIDSTSLEIDNGKTDDEGNPIKETITLEAPTQVVSSRTLVPVRAISESFGLNVDWNEDEQKVVITTDSNEDDSWKENIGSINLSDLTFDGSGVEINDNQIKITKGGDYTISGTLTDGNITVSTKEKVKLRLDGASITSSENPCIYFEQADKAYITLTDKAENYLCAQSCETGAIYSKENLEIKGTGKIYIESLTGHGIKASDNLSIESGDITINAASDGIHINDTFNMTDGNLNITAEGDGIDSESIVDILGGTINIETNATPIETAQPSADTTQKTQRPGMWEEAADVEFEKSSKGINAEWMMCISGGEITVNSASHAIHCQDEIQIDGGRFYLSSKYDKGISAHGNLAISGSKTYIDISKSTEGIESKNVMTINDGIIKVVSTDDALNATGGNSGKTEPGGNFGGTNAGGERVPPEGFEREQRVFADDQNAENDKIQKAQGTRPPKDGYGELGNMNPNFEASQNGEPKPSFEIPGNGEFTSPGEEKTNEFVREMRGNMKDCLIINDGYLELMAEDDCIDSNGNLIINGGTIKASNPNGAFSGASAIVDPDGTASIGEKANLIFAAGRGNAGSLKLKQNTITVYCENMHNANDTIEVADASGNIIYEYSPLGKFSSVLISSENLKTGEKYKITIGNEELEATISEQSTVVGTKPAGNMGIGKNRFGK